MLSPTIYESARKHGITDADMLHAMRMAVSTFREGNLVMYIGPDTRGAHLLEVGVVNADDHTPSRIIHAMRARPRYL